MIRQAITCDICGAEKKQTNHWFIAGEHDGELRITGWTARTRPRAGSKHLCGQACLHKLVDDFMVRIIARPELAPSTALPVRHSTILNDRSLTAQPPSDNFESSARLITVPSVPPRFPAATAPIPMPAADAAPSEPRRYNSRTWHVEAWQRERKRNMESAARRADPLPRRFSHA